MLSIHREYGPPKTAHLTNGSYDRSEYGTTPNIIFSARSKPTMTATCTAALEGIEVG
jgi:hypothetical protein